MLEKIWKPDTYFHNGLDSYLHSITRPNKLLRISENGDITYSIRFVLFMINENSIFIFGSDLFSTDMFQLFSPTYFQIQIHICCFTFAEPVYLRLTCLNLLHYFNCATSFISLQPQFISFWITLLKIHLDRYSLSTQNFDHKWVIK